MYISALLMDARGSWWHARCFRRAAITFFAPFPLLFTWPVGVLSFAVAGGGLCLPWAWYFGMLVGTGYLVAGLLTTGWSFAGRWIVLLFHPAGPDEPHTASLIQGWFSTGRMELLCTLRNTDPLRRQQSFRQPAWTSGTCNSARRPSVCSSRSVSSLETGPSIETPRVLGLDEFAVRRGRRTNDRGGLGAKNAAKERAVSGRGAHRPDTGIEVADYACLSRNTWPVSRLTATTCTLFRSATLLPCSRLFKTLLLFRLLLRSPLRIGLPFNTSCKMRTSF